MLLLLGYGFVVPNEGGSKSLLGFARQFHTLWHLDTGNLIGDFDERSAAMAAVREEIEANQDASRLMLEDEDDRSSPPVHGQELADAAFRSERPAALWLASLQRTTEHISLGVPRSPPQGVGRDD